MNFGFDTSFSDTPFHKRQMADYQALAHALTDYSLKTDTVLDYDNNSKKLILYTPNDAIKSSIPKDLIEADMPFDVQITHNMKDIWNLRLNKTMPYLFRTQVQSHINEVLSKPDGSMYHRKLTPKFILKELLNKEIILESAYNTIRKNDKLKKKFDNLINKIKHEMRAKMGENKMEEEYKTGHISESESIISQSNEIGFLSKHSSEFDLESTHSFKMECESDTNSLHGNMSMAQAVMTKLNPKTFVENYYKLLSVEMKSFVLKRTLIPKELSFFDHSFMK